MTILCGILFGAINVAFFLVGFYFGGKKEKTDSVIVDSQNKDAVKELMKWMNYSGGNK